VSKCIEEKKGRLGGGRERGTPLLKRAILRTTPYLKTGGSQGSASLGKKKCSSKRPTHPLNRGVLIRGDWLRLDGATLRDDPKTTRKRPLHTREKTSVGTLEEGVPHHGAGRNGRDAGAQFKKKMKWSNNALLANGSFAKDEEKDDTQLTLLTTRENAGVSSKPWGPQRQVTEVSFALEGKVVKKGRTFGINENPGRAGSKGKLHSRNVKEHVNANKSNGVSIRQGPMSKENKKLRMRGVELDS